MEKHIDGITVVEEHICRLVELPAFIACGVVVTLLCSIVLFVYWNIYKKSYNRSDRSATKFCSVIVIILFIVFWIFQINGHNKIHMEYTIIIDDNVSFNDFYEKYEIVSMDGTEYRVVEKQHG